MSVVTSGPDGVGPPGNTGSVKGRESKESTVTHWIGGHGVMLKRGETHSRRLRPHLRAARDAQRRNVYPCGVDFAVGGRREPEVGGA